MVEGRSLDGTKFHPGYMAINNFKHQSYLTAVVQLLMRIIPLRDHCLSAGEVSGADLPRANVLIHFSRLVRKVWNPKSFRAQISPHSLLHAISEASGKRFANGEPQDPAQFTPWLLSSLRQGLRLLKQPDVVGEHVQGECMLTTLKQVEGKQHVEEKV